jgi:hypothetical protein
LLEKVDILFPEMIRIYSFVPVDFFTLEEFVPDGRGSATLIMASL